MCSRAAARSVAAMRPSLSSASPPPLEPRRRCWPPQRPRMPPTRSTAAANGPAIRSSSRPIPRRTTLQLDRHLLAATCADGRGAGGGALTPAEPAPGFAPSPRELLMARNAKGRSAGTQYAVTTSGVAATRRDPGQAQARRASGTLSATVKIVDTATGADDRLLPDEAAAGSPPASPGSSTAVPPRRASRSSCASTRPRKRVNDVHDHLASRSDAGGLHPLPDHFVNFPVKRTGGFGNPFSDDVDIDAGAQAQLRLHVAGR